MGINQQTFQLMIAENKYKPISGDVLCIGKQTVNVSLETLSRLVADNDLDAAKLQEIIKSERFDAATRHARNTLYDHDLFAIFGNEHTYNCLDRSDYEGANILQDMNEPLAEELHNKFDIVYNGSCMDNVFNPVSFLQNTSRLLKPGGRVIHAECASSVAGAYLMYSPEWFFSYYAINKFVDCKVYVTIARDASDSVYEFKTDLYEWSPFYTRTEGYNYIDACKSVNGLMHVILVAEKGSESTVEENPVQMQYLDEKVEDWRQMYHQFEGSNRPKLNIEKGNKEVRLPLDSNHFTYIRSGF